MTKAIKNDARRAHKLLLFSVINGQHRFYELYECVWIVNTRNKKAIVVAYIYSHIIFIWLISSYILFIRLTMICNAFDSNNNNNPRRVQTPHLAYFIKGTNESTNRHKYI